MEWDRQWSPQCSSSATELALSSQTETPKVVTVEVFDVFAEQRYGRQVIDSTIVLNRPGRYNSGPSRIAECTIGDPTGCIILTARNEQGMPSGMPPC